MTNTKQKLKRIATIAIVLTLVAQLSISPVVASDDTDNKIEDQIGESVCSAGSMTNPLAWMSPACKFEYSGVSGATAEETHYNIYSQGVFAEDSRKQITTEKESRISQTRQLAIAQAKWRVIEEMNNGSSKAEAYSVANSEINEMFGTMQKSMYVSQNRQIQQLKSVDQTVLNTDGLGEEEGMKDLYLEGAPNDDLDKKENVLQFSNHTADLWDGSTVNVTTARYAWADYYSGTSISREVHYKELAWYNGELSTNASYSYPDDGVHNDGRSKLSVHHPQNPDRDAVDEEFAYIVNYNDFKFALEELSDSRDSALNESDQLVDSIYANYEPGDIDVKDAQGPLERTITAGSDYQETGSSAYLLQSASLMGMEVADGASMTVESDMDNDSTIEIRNGSVYAPAGTFGGEGIQVGEEYNPQDLEHNVTFVWTPEDAEAEEMTLENNFTVREAWNPQNESETYDSVGFESNDFSTTDTDELNGQIENLTQQMDEIEKNQEEQSIVDDILDGGGSGLPDGAESFLKSLGIGLTGGLTALAAIGVLLLIVFIRANSI